MNATYDRTVGELVAERPARSRVFESFGIDYCCGGRRTLDEACARAGAAAAEVVQALQACDASAPADEIDWNEAPTANLIEHIVSDYHDVLRRELPRLSAMGRKVAAVHGAEHPHLSTCCDVFEAMRTELEQHMQKEEWVLFPMIQKLAEGSTELHCGSISNPIAVMEDEHDSVGLALRDLRSLTDGFEPPPGACGTYRAWLDGLASLEREMHQHVHKENNILFPRALRRQAELVR